jgi:hypothetical protein
MTEEEAIAFFERHGSFCRTGNGTTFALEAFKNNPEPLQELVAIWGGSVVKPPPAAPNRYTWRLYGKRARALWSSLRLQVSEAKRERGDRKLSHCNERFN